MTNEELEEMKKLDAKRHYYSAMRMWLDVTLAQFLEENRDKIPSNTTFLDVMNWVATK